MPGTPGAPSPPQVISRPKAGNGTIEFSWKPPTNQGSTPVTEYILDCPLHQIQYYYSANEVSAKVFGLVNGVKYRFRIAAKNAHGQSPYAVFDPLQPGVKPPDAPTDLTFKWDNGSSLLLSWHPPAYYGDSIIKYYAITAKPYNHTIAGEILKFGQAGDNPKRNIIGLSPNILYSMYVQAINDAGYSIPSSPSNYVCPQVALWLDASDPKYFNLNVTTILSWLDRSGLERNALPYTPGILYDSSTKSVYFDNSGSGPANYLISSVPAGTFTNGFTFFIVFKTNLDNFKYTTNLSRSGTLLARTINLTNNAAPWNMAGLIRQLGDGVQTNINTINSTYNLSISGLVPTLISITCSNPENGSSVYNEYVNGFNVVNYTLPGSTKFADVVNQLTIGATTLIPSNEFFYGGIHEIMAFPSALNIMERQQIEEYLTQKWNIKTLVFWMDASDETSIITTTDTTIWYDPIVTQVKDKSGFEFHGTVLQNPDGPIVRIADSDGIVGLEYYGGTVNQPFITFPISTGLFTKGMTVFVVFRSNGESLTAVGAPYGSLFNRYGAIDASKPAPFAVANTLRDVGNQQIFSRGISPNNILKDIYRTLYCGVVTPEAFYSEYINGHFLEYSKQLANYSDTGAALGLGSYNGIGFTGFMYEVRMFGYPMTDTERQAVETELKAKWSIIDNPNPGPLAVFTYTGAVQKFVVPPGRTSLTIHVWGAGGAGFTDQLIVWNNTNNGGNGGYITGTLPVTQGQVLYIVVGGGGIVPQIIGQDANAFGGGGTAVTQPDISAGFFNGGGGGGGGYSGIFLNSVDHSGALCIAGGGGGGGLSCFANHSYTKDGGHGGITATQGAPFQLDAIYGGYPGTQTSGGLGGACLNIYNENFPSSPSAYGELGSALQGGRCPFIKNSLSYPADPAPWTQRSSLPYKAGGGGGGGYYGGGAGAGTSSYNSPIGGASGGGGGSSWYGSLINPDHVDGSDNNGNPGYQTKPGYINNAGLGGTGSHNHGYDGLVIIY